MVVASEAVAAEGGKALIIINRTIFFFPYDESLLYWYQIAILFLRQSRMRTVKKMFYSIHLSAKDAGPSFFLIPNLCAVMQFFALRSDFYAHCIVKN